MRLLVRHTKEGKRVDQFDEDEDAMRRVSLLLSPLRSTHPDRRDLMRPPPPSVFKYMYGAGSVMRPTQVCQPSRSGCGQQCPPPSQWRHEWGDSQDEWLCNEG
jgi:hypothetical protein